MFKTKKDWAIAMANGREFGDAHGWIYKFSEEKVFRNSPFIVLRHGNWESIDSRWCHFDEVEEIFGNMPNLAVDTKVLVKETDSDTWEHHHFKEWNAQGEMVCHNGGKTSFTAGNKKPYWWRLWKVADGPHKGKSNVTSGEGK